MNLASSGPLGASGSGARARLKVFALGIPQDRLWFWGRQSSLSFLDQGLFSGSSFLLNVFLARWLSKEAYGAFAVCFAGMLFLTGFHNVLLIEPMTVIGPSCYPDRLTGYFGAQLRTHFLLVGPLSLLALAVGGILMLGPARSVLTPAVASSAIGFPLILLFYLVRRMCYVVQNPMAAVRASAMYGVTLVLGAFALEHAQIAKPEYPPLRPGRSNDVQHHDQRSFHGRAQSFRLGLWAGAATPESAHGRSRRRTPAPGPGGRPSSAATSGDR